jgi:hypothetical protein
MEIDGNEFIDAITFTPTSEGPLGTYKAVLYKGKQTLHILPESVESYEGSVEMDEDGILITGNATLTMYVSSIM